MKSSINGHFKNVKSKYNRNYNFIKLPHTIIDNSIQQIEIVQKVIHDAIRTIKRKIKNINVIDFKKAINTRKKKMKLIGKNSIFGYCLNVNFDKGMFVELSVIDILALKSENEEIMKIL